MRVWKRKGGQHSKVAICQSWILPECSTGLAAIVRAIRDLNIWEILLQFFFRTSSPCVGGGFAVVVVVGNSGNVANLKLKPLFHEIEINWLMWLSFCIWGNIIDSEPLQNPEDNHEQFILPPCQRLRASLSCRNSVVPTEPTKLPDQRKHSRPVWFS